ESVSETRFEFSFLVSPKRILGDNDGRVRALEVEDTTLETRPDGKTRDVGLGTTREIPADTVVFCIGDRVDETLGLPLDKWGDYAKHPEPRFPSGGLSYEAYDPETSQAVEGVFLAGWAREASSGLVGAARKDGTQAAQAVLQYLQVASPKDDDALDALNAKVLMLSEPVVRESDLKKLQAAEMALASEFNLPEFKYSSNEEMLAVMGLLRQRERG
ncbi:MAG: hypothetical protein ACRDFQ_01415, partial [Anaerolineales bacterium]